MPSDVQLKVRNLHLHAHTFSIVRGGVCTYVMYVYKNRESPGHGTRSSGGRQYPGKATDRPRKDQGLWGLRTVIPNASGAIPLSVQGVEKDTACNASQRVNMSSAAPFPSKSKTNHVFISEINE